LSDLPPRPQIQEHAPKPDEGEKGGLNSVDLLKGDKPIKYVGDATMEKDGSINIHFRKTADGKDADAYVHYKTTNPFYKEVLDHLKGLTPGKTVLVTPFPDKPASDAKHQK
jgi:hypothetical protein